MNNYSDYIVIAHLPKDEEEVANNPALHPTEWVIYTGVLAKKQAMHTAKVYEQYFKEVQVRKVGAQESSKTLAMN